MDLQIITDLFQKYRNFNDATLIDVSIDSLEVICLTIAPYVWNGFPKYEGDILLKFWGVKDPEGILAKFQAFPKKESEIGYLGLDSQSLHWKSGAFRFNMIAERRDYSFSFTCNDISLVFIKATN